MQIVRGNFRIVVVSGQTEEEVGRRHQGMDRPGICQVPKGSGEQGIMEESGGEINHLWCPNNPHG